MPKFNCIRPQNDGLSAQQTCASHVTQCRLSTEKQSKFGDGHNRLINPTIDPSKNWNAYEYDAHHMKPKIPSFRHLIERNSQQRPHLQFCRWHPVLYSIVAENTLSIMQCKHLTRYRQWESSNLWSGECCWIWRKRTICTLHRAERKNTEQKLESLENCIHIRTENGGSWTKWNVNT